MEGIPWRKRKGRRRSRWLVAPRAGATLSNLVKIPTWSWQGHIIIIIITLVRKLDSHSCILQAKSVYTHFPSGKRGRKMIQLISKRAIGSCFTGCIVEPNCYASRLPIYTIDDVRHDAYVQWIKAVRWTKQNKLVTLQCITDSCCLKVSSTKLLFLPLFVHSALSSPLHSWGGWGGAT
jgi:hypothetical protein